MGRLIILEGGSCLMFAELILQSKTKKNLLKSLGFLKNQDELEQFFYRFNLNANELKKNFKTNILEEELAAVILWTTNLIYKIINKSLVEDQDLGCWEPYLRCLCSGLKHFPYYRGKAFRGIRNFQDPYLYKKGQIFNWKNISALTNSQEISKKFSNSEGTIFEVEIMSARDISSVSK